MVPGMVVGGGYGVMVGSGPSVRICGVLGFRHPVLFAALDNVSFLV